MTDLGIVLVHVEEKNEGRHDPASFDKKSN
jgi:hypothetical protein